MVVLQYANFHIFLMNCKSFRIFKTFYIFFNLAICPITTALYLDILHSKTCHILFPLFHGTVYRAQLILIYRQWARDRKDSRKYLSAVQREGADGLCELGTEVSAHLLNLKEPGSHKL